MQTVSRRPSLAWPVGITLAVPVVLFGLGTLFVPEGDADGLGLLIVVLVAVEVLLVLALTFWVGSRASR